MMTPDKNFRMKPQLKTMLTLTKFKDAHERGAWLRGMIDAQLCEESARRAALKSKDHDSSAKGKPRGAVAPD
jgi:hypothetical protein